MESIGKIVLMPKGTYSSSTTYNHLDWVRYNGKAWVCKQDNVTGVTPTEGTTWTVLAEDGQDATAHGLPSGGSTNQVLAKASATDYDVTWVNQSGGGGGADEDLIRDTVGWTGKNLANADATEIGVAWNGTANADRARLIIPIEPSTSYVLSVSGVNGFSFIGYCLTQTATPVSPTEISSFPLTLDSRITDNYLTIAFSKTGVTQADVDALQFMLRKSSVTDATYEPYHPTVKQTLRDAELISGKNINRSTYRNITNNSVTFTLRENGKVQANGTASGGDAYDNADPILGFTADFTGQCIFSGGVNADAYVYVYDYNILNRAYTDASKTTHSGDANGVDRPVYIEKGHRYNLILRVVNTKTVSNVVFSPMLRLATETDPAYEPYYKTLKEVIETKGDWDSRNIFDYSQGALDVNNTTHNFIENGVHVVTSNSAWGNVYYGVENKEPNTDYVLSCDFDYVSGLGCVAVKGNDTIASAGTNLVQETSISSDKHLDLPFNSGTYKYMIVQFITTGATATNGEANVKNIIIQKASNANKDYTPHRPALEDKLNIITADEEDDVRGVNLCESRCPTNTVNGITFTKNNDGSYTISGTNDGTDASNLRVDQLTPAGTQNLKSYNGRYTLSLFDENNNVVQNVKLILMQNSTWASPLQATSNNGGKSTGTVTGDNYFIYLQVLKDASFATAKTVYPMLRLASIADSTYRPYNEQSLQNQLNVLSGRGAKNLLRGIYRSETTNGITYAFSATGVNVSGTASANAVFYFMSDNYIKTGEYIISAEGLISGVTIGVEAFNNSQWVKDFCTLSSTNGSARISIDYNGYTKVVVYIKTVSGTAISSAITIKAMIRFASDPDDTYHAYAMTNEELTANKSSVAVHDNVGTASATSVRRQTIYCDDNTYTVNGSAYMEQTANSASFTFTNSIITTSSAIDTYSSIYGEAPTSVDVPSNGTCNVTFSDAVSRTVRIYIR